MKKLLKKNSIILLLSVVIIPLFLFLGYLVGLHELPTYGFFRRVELNTLGNYFDRTSNYTLHYFDSVFLRLYSEENSIRDRMKRSGSGGGMTSFGDDVLLITYDGQIFASHTPDTIITIDINVPDNGFEDYRRVAQSDEFRNLHHNFNIFRYNDILYYESAIRRGIAISYTEFDDTNNCYRNTVAVLPISQEVRSVNELSASSSDWDIVFRANPCLPFKKIHDALEGGLAGGRLVFRAPSTIFLGSGDYHFDGIYGPDVIAQKPEYEYGKIINIDLDTKSSHIVSAGIRNPQGIAIDREGSLWIVEHGLRGGDELNLIKEGNNYGWPFESLGTQYSKLPIPGSSDKSYGRHQNFTEPVFAWLPSIAISNLTLIENFHPSWNNDLLMGSLKSRNLYHIRIKNNRVLFAEEIKIGDRIRYVHQHTDGRIVLWTDSKRLIFLTGQPYSDNFVNDYLEEQVPNTEQREMVKNAINGCRQCHSIEPAEHTNTPSLAGVYNAEIASTIYPDYSTALSGKKGLFWTPENLKKFLKDPQEFAPGSSMPDPGINDERTLEELILFLETLNSRTTE